MANTSKTSGFEKFIKGIETVGNKLPHPFWLFVYLSVIVMVLSFLLNKAGVSATYMAAGRDGAAAKETTVSVVNLLGPDNLRSIFTDFVKTYINFTPLGLVMTMTLGIGVLEQSGLISAFMRKTILGAPSWAISAVLAIIGINANLASDAGIIFTPAIGGAIYKALGRNPWVGIITGFAAATGGFTANFAVAGTDALLAGITQSALAGMNIQDSSVHVLMNWYFLLFSTLTLTLVTTLITEKFLVKHLGDERAIQDSSNLSQHEVTADEKRGLRWAGIALIGIALVLAATTVPENGFFRDPATHKIIPNSPFLSGIIGILFFVFFLLGIAYGYGSKTIKKAGDVPKLMQSGLTGSLSFLVVVLPASMFIGLFNKSNLTTILSVKGADALEAIGLGGIPLLVLFILLCTFVNLFMTSGSAKWLILAPIFVPMFYRIGFSPALTQIAYRIGDSSTNSVTPLSYYMPVVIGLLEQYRPKNKENQEVGMGTVISLILPYAVSYLTIFTIQLIVWYLLKLPLGPGAGVSVAP
ncbi:MAG: AbgT family transporter [Spirochaetaceae bacterium]|jgi:aminobenzoyl-glutamate transport protein|nr:AbgT family transporter [Spirochaetaceae bacterium]